MKHRIKNKSVRETEAQLLHEDYCREIIQEQLQEDDEHRFPRILLKKTDQFCAYDWMLMRGQYCFGFAEFKAFKKPKTLIDRTGEMWMQLHKMTAGREVHEVTGLPFIFFIHLNEGLFFHVLRTDKPYKARFLDSSMKEQREYKSAIAVIPSKELHDLRTERDLLWEHFASADQADYVT